MVAIYEWYRNVWHGLSLTFTLLLVYCAFCSPAQAQSMYRCGTVYQDRPCEGAQQGKVIGSTGAAQSSATTAVDQNCARRGAAAQKLVWAREGGATEEKALSGARSQEEMKLVSMVYRNRGTSSEVRAAVEADCASEKERAAQAAVLMDAARLLDPSISTPARQQVRANEPQARPTAASTASIGKDNSTQEAVRKKNECEYLRSRLDDITSRQRAGGSAAAMDGLNQQRRDANDKVSRAGC